MITSPAKFAVIRLLILALIDFLTIAMVLRLLFVVELEVTTTVRNTIIQMPHRATVDLAGVETLVGIEITHHLLTGVGGLVVAGLAAGDLAVVDLVVVGMVGEGLMVLLWALVTEVVMLYLEITLTFVQGREIGCALIPHATISTLQGGSIVTIATVPVTHPLEVLGGATQAPL